MQSKTRFLATALAVSGALALGACANSPGYGASYPSGGTAYPAGQQGAYAQFGQVTNVEMVRGGSATGGAAGAVIGGAVGGLAGNQVGGGRGRTAATVAGVVGGAILGTMIENNVANTSDHYRVTVRFDDGSVRSFNYAESPNVAIGQRVRLEGNQLYR